MTQRQAAGTAVKMPTVRLRGVGKNFAGRPVFADVTCAVPEGAKICVIGPNGSGKSTLLRIMAGYEEPSDGTVGRAAGLRIGYLSQNPHLDPTATVRSVVEEAVADVRKDLRRLQEISTLLAARPDDPRLLTELGDLSDSLDHQEGWDLDTRIAQALQALRCPVPDASVATLSGGEQRRVALCRVLVPRPDLLFLDEPTNHLDAVSAQWLQEHLTTYPGTVVVVTHDRSLLDGLPRWILELEHGQAWRYDGNYTAYLRRKVDRLAVHGRKHARRRRRLLAELQWIGEKAAQPRRACTSRLRAYEIRAVTAERAVTSESLFVN